MKKNDWDDALARAEKRLEMWSEVISAIDGRLHEAVLGGDSDMADLCQMALAAVFSAEDVDAMRADHMRPRRTQDGQMSDVAGIAITVCSYRVTLTNKHQTGASIKAAAVAQGVPIRQNYSLTEIPPSGWHRIITDNMSIDVDTGFEFWAIPIDDGA